MIIPIMANVLQTHLIFSIGFAMKIFDCKNMKILLEKYIFFLVSFLLKWPIIPCLKMGIEWKYCSTTAVKKSCHKWKY